MLFNRIYMLHFHSILMKFECLILLGSFKNPSLHHQMHQL